MKITTILPMLLLACTHVYAAEVALIDDDENIETEAEPRMITQPGLRECKVDADCTIIEGVCDAAEPVNIQRAPLKQEANRKARAVAECMPVNADDNFKITGAICIENECVIKKKRR